MKKSYQVLIALAIGVGINASVQAHDSFSIGFNVGTPSYYPVQPVSNYGAPPVGYYGAPPVTYYGPSAVIVTPPPRSYYQAPPQGYYRPAPIIYGAPPVYIQQSRTFPDRGRGWGHDHHRDYDRNGRGGWGHDHHD